MSGTATESESARTSGRSGEVASWSDASAEDDVLELEQIGLGVVGRIAGRDALESVVVVARHAAVRRHEGRLVDDLADALRVAVDAPSPRVEPTGARSSLR